MDSPFAPPEPPVEPPYAVPPAPMYGRSVDQVGGPIGGQYALGGASGGTAPGTDRWPVQPDGRPTFADDMPEYNPNRPSVVMDQAVLPKKRHRKGIVIGVVACLLSAAGAFAIARASESRNDTSATSSAVAGGPAIADPASTSSATPAASANPASTPAVSGSPVPIGNTSSGLDVISIVAKIRPSVVKVAVDISGGAQGTGQGVGTGVILTADGEILTNAHVVADASKVRVVLDGSTEPIDAKVLGVDVGNDLALIKVDKKGLPVMTLADSTKVQVGQPVVAMGYALDLAGDVSVTSGIISALNRSMVTDNGALDGLLQTDAAISSGNSGGPLVNAGGEMIGINTAVARGDSTNTATNIGFAIATKQINRILGQLKTAGTTAPAQGYLGIGVDDRHDGGSGATVSQVQPASPAAKAGLQVGDVVTSVNGVAINGQAGLIAAIRDSAPGDKVSIDYSRNGKAATATATLDARPSS